MALTRSSSAGILVIGDVMLDRYLEGTVERISPEAPVPVLRVRHTFERPGGAANTAVNAASMGGRVMLVGVTGSDPEAGRLRALVEAESVSAESLLPVRGLPTTVKTRLLVGHRQIARFDEEGHLDAADVRRSLCEVIDRSLPQADLVVVSDYAKGVCDGIVCRTVVEGCRRHGVRVIVDPKGADFTKYTGAFAVTPNQTEAAAAVGFPIGDVEDGLRAARCIRESFHIDSVVVTMGDKGLVLADGQGAVVMPVESRQVFDVTGAGDTVVAMLSVALAEGLSIREACRLANAAAQVQISRVGATTVTRQEVLATHEPPVTAARKIVSTEQLASAVGRARAAGKRIGFTNGCFDMLHHGHVATIEAAAAECDLLVVGMNSDASVRRLKGPSRPVVSADARSIVLAALSSVAWVCEFDDDTPLALIRAISPDVLVKGGDYSDKDIVGSDIVRAHGGRVVIVPTVPEASTTGLVDRLREAGVARGFA